jgi:NhaP-type Na+/H+ and K+/H+ antiporter
MRGVWVSLVIRHGEPVDVRGSTVLAAGDEVVVLVDPDEPTDPEPLFTRPAPT